MTEPLTSTEDLRRGDVVQVARLQLNKSDGHEYWWRFFACVTYIQRNSARRRFECVILKMKPDLDRDTWDIDLRESPQKQVVTKLPEDRWPQGVCAMRMKMIALGQVKLGE